MVACAENEELAAYVLKKWEEMANQRPKGISENVEMTLTKAYSNLCASKTPVKTLKEFSQIKWVFSAVFLSMKIRPFCSYCNFGVLGVYTVFLKKKIF